MAWPMSAGWHHKVIGQAYGSLPGDLQEDQSQDQTLSSDLL